MTYIAKKTVKIVVSSKDSDELSKRLLGEHSGTNAYKYFWNNVSSVWYVDPASKEGKRIIRDYAITQFPFALISDEDNEIGAVYSEEEPITLDRLNEKL